MSTLKRALAAAGVLFVCALLLVPSAATGQISGTKHNLSVSNGGSDPTSAGIEDFDRICAYCHAPHNTGTGAPLWNRADPAGPYTMYTSSTINMTIEDDPVGVSAACLSCHDGTIGLDVLTHTPTGGTAQSTTAGDNTIPTSSDAYFGTNLGNDHPISVVYNTSKDNDFHSVTDARADGVEFYNGRVECASCHDPHDNSITPFLRTSNSGSAMCLACHNK